MIPKPHRIVDPQAIKTARKPYCEYCRKWGYTEAHHIKTRGSGGDDVPSNLVGLCRECHDKAHRGLISKERLREIVGRREDGYTIDTD